jgi:hypothetical protein
MADDLSGLRASISGLVDQKSVDAMKHVAGQAAKKAAIDVAQRDLGGDAAFSGFRRRVPLKAGYDLEADSRVTLNLSPKGLWMLANDGRRRPPPGGRVYPRKGKGALSTPWGPRKSVRASRSRGLGTLADAEVAVERETFKAVDVELTQRIGRF